ncbi:hypothetical protein PACTADRAFT_48566 [Pachysolen tannophilus NRRL Y-2460]|uniref:Transcriptional adapter 2 n=1 Tax=Pachysolen tannophilus NRRL Y-2460 TaxID=669874 RepID=A0A1E4TYB3_PACTA|nr:hypothetical protein PACTADRAFT_48566 [Pachysolen tannophilus NRRL Y-2460]
MSNSFHCDVCSTDCTNRVRIRCAECEEYDLCVGCFSQGLSTLNHKPYHDYRIIEQNSYPIFSEDWGADEELLLIEGAQKFGLGNWQDVADHIGNRSKDEVAKHYIKYYIQSPYYPIPDLNKDFSYITPQKFARRRKERIDARKDLPLPPPKKPVASVPLCHEIQGFMPGRLEFETEAENDAELTVKDMVFDPDDQKNDIELKLTILDIYNSRLTTRAERKRLLIQNGLLDYRKTITNDKKRSKEEKELHNKLKPFARIMTPQDFEELTNDAIAELKCRTRIAQLQEWRKNGITSLEQGAKYEKDKIARAAAIQRYASLGALGSSRHTANSINAASTLSRNRSSSHTASPAPGLDFNSRKVTKPAQPLDITHAADYDLLSQEERILCSTLRLYPKPYLVIKETLFRELLRTGGILKKRTARELLKIDVNKTSKIYEFFVQQKWCTP